MSRVAVVLVTVTASTAWATKAELPGPDGRGTRINIYSVTASGGMSSIDARRALGSYRHDALSGCRLPSTGRSLLRGRVTVAARLGQDGRLTVIELQGTDEHAGLEACMRRRIGRWRLSSRAADAGTLIRFKLFISRVGHAPRGGGVLGALSGSGKAVGNVFGAGGLGSSGGGGYGIGGLGTRGSRGSRTYYKSGARLADVRAKGALSQSVISWGLGQQNLESGARYCQQSAARGDDKLARLAGELRLALRVDKHGAIDRVEVQRATIDDAKFRACVLGKVLRSTFPESQGSTEIDFRLVFPQLERRSY